MAGDNLRMQVVIGEAVRDFVPSLAELRIEVFREYPYLYEGSLGYETEYLLSYARSDRSVFVLAFDGAEVVGVSTGLPLAEADAEFRKPFVARGISVDQVFYFGESVLRQQYRGQGIGSRFMNEREAYARSFGTFNLCAFCAVQREEDHPAKPDGYLDLQEFWRKYEFVERADLETSFSWREIGVSVETAKTMRFWLKEIPS